MPVHRSSEYFGNGKLLITRFGDFPLHASRNSGISLKQEGGSATDGEIFDSPDITDCKRVNIISSFCPTSAQPVPVSDATKVSCRWIRQNSVSHVSNGIKEPNSGESGYLVEDHVALIRTLTTRAT